ncbi:MAG TPA: alpha/beta hydrolase [Xanthobacteraceae bacterium]|nr:alpha/beta hydrolase [Xanthobacteraceae bacterium]
MTLHSIPANPVPEGAVTGHLTTPDNIKIRFARWNPTMPRKGTVCIFGGRGDMIEKYFEAIGDLRARGFAVAIVDWRGQGGSQRLLSDPRKGYVRNFADYQLDLEVFMREVVLPDCPSPFFALAHSMGGAIVLEALRQGRRWFDRVVLSSPMIGLYGRLGTPFVRFATRAGVLVGLGRAYIPGGGPFAITNKPFLGNLVTSDPVRYQRAASVVEAAPELGMGSPTFRWASTALKTMLRLQDPLYPSSLRQPMLILAAGADQIVSTVAIERFAVRLRAGSHLVVPGSKHELMMERDVFRTQFWAAFDAFIPGSPSYR